MNQDNPNNTQFPQPIGDPNTDIPPLQNQGIQQENKKAEDQAANQNSQGITTFTTLKKRKLPQTKKIIATLLSALLLVGGVGVGILLTKQSQDIRERAQTTTATPTATPIICGGLSGAGCPPNYDCVIPIGAPPDAQGVCRPTSSTGTTGPTIDCLGVRAYRSRRDPGNSQWIPLSDADLRQLRPGDVVTFTVVGKAPDPTKFTRARFRINQESVIEVQSITNTKPRSPSDPTDEIELFTDYTIPPQTLNFRVQAAIYHEDFGWIGQLANP